MKFFGHLSWLPEKQLTKRIIDYVTSLKNCTLWLDEIRKNLNNENLRPADIPERETFRHKVHDWKVISEQPKEKQYRPKRSDECKQAFLERMKAYWKNKKNSKEKLIEIICLTFSFSGENSPITINFKKFWCIGKWTSFNCTKYNRTNFIVTS